jgi:uncharacterized protein (TIGR02453 family)
MTTSEPFSGFTPAFFRFFESLAKNNNRAWFLQNKPRYLQEIVVPMLAFIEAMQKPLRQLAPHYRVIAKLTGGSMFRIYRDARFSNDKRPYKEHAAFHFRHEQGKDAHAPGYYLHLEPGRVFFGGGIWVPPAAKLSTIRDTIMDSPGAWARVKNDPKIIGYGGIQGKGLKTAPRGVDRNHPQIEDLRRKSFFVMNEVRPELAGKADFIDLVADTYRDCEPMMEFICHALEIPF